MRRLALALLISLTPACDYAISGSYSIAGTYTLQTVNGAPPPNTTDLLDDAYTLFTGNTYSQISHTRTTTGGQATIVERRASGSYGTGGTSITLTPSTGGLSTVGIIDGNTMTIVQSGVTLVYRK
jgi:hypothetical protein